MGRSGHSGAAVVLAAVVFAVLLELEPGGAYVTRAIDDLGQLSAAVVASAAAAWRSRHAAPGAARSWLLLSLASGSWAVGEAVWSYLELLSGDATPFPSLADLGFLMFPVLAGCGLLLWPTAAVRGAARWRTLLDAALVAGALFIVTSVSALGAVLSAGADSRLAFAVSLAYPIADLVLLTVTVVIVAHTGRTASPALGLLTAGLTCLSLADSGFAFLSATGTYRTGAWPDIGWFTGFLLLAAAAAASPADDEPAARGLETTRKVLLPYVPAAIGLAVALGHELRGGGDRPALLAAALVITALLTRQLLVVLDNRGLVRELVRMQDELRHQAFHDPLTGLANRALFADRLRHCLDLHCRDLRPLGLLYCDLDGFKAVNDTLGHDAGDEVLRAVAERVRAATRPGDTVARMGGDEFAVLLEDGGDAAAVATRLLEAMAQPAVVGRHTIPLAASIGIAHLDASDAPVSGAVLLHRADTAMYAAKRSGKGRTATWHDELERQPA